VSAKDEKFAAILPVLEQLEKEHGYYWTRRAVHHWLKKVNGECWDRSQKKSDKIRSVWREAVVTAHRLVKK
jgi:hypothetical protein